MSARARGDLVLPLPCRTEAGGRTIAPAQQRVPGVMRSLGNGTGPGRGGLDLDRRVADADSGPVSAGTGPRSSPGSPSNPIPWGSRIPAASLRVARFAEARRIEASIPP